MTTKPLGIPFFRKNCQLKGLNFDIKFYRHPMNSILAKTCPKPTRRSSGNLPLLLSMNFLRSSHWWLGSMLLLYLLTSQFVSKDPTMMYSWKWLSQSKKARQTYEAAAIRVATRLYVCFDFWSCHLQFLQRRQTELRAQAESTFD